MKSKQTAYVKNRVLKLNVGFLLVEGPGNSHDTAFDTPRIRLAEDLMLDYVRGPLRLTRAKEGILVQGVLHVGVAGECLRCLEPMLQDVEIGLEELFAYPASPYAEFSVSHENSLDLSPLLRAEVLIVASRGALCRPDCKGLCVECGQNLNEAACDCEGEVIDPRFAQLKQLLDSE